MIKKITYICLLAGMLLVNSCTNLNNVLLIDDSVQTLPTDDHRIHIDLSCDFIAGTFTISNASADYNPLILSNLDVLFEINSDDMEEVERQLVISNNYTTNFTFPLQIQPLRSTNIRFYYYYSILNSTLDRGDIIDCTVNQMKFYYQTNSNTVFIENVTWSHEFDVIEQ